MVLGVFLHSALAYAPFPGSRAWAIVDPQQTRFATLLVVVIYWFRLPAFFFLSGYFARLLLAKQDRVAFAVNRLKRIVLPFGVALIPMKLAEEAVLNRFGQSLPRSAGEPWLMLGHLWFLYYLAILIALYLLVTAQPDWTNSRMMRIVDRVTRYAGALVSPLVLGLLVVAPLAGADGLPTARVFQPDLAILAFCGIFFFGGVLFRRSDGLIGGLSQHLTLRFILAVGSLAAMSFAPSGFPHLYLRGVFAWAMSFAFIGLFLKLYSRPRPVTAFLADASYWTYIVHPPAVYLMQGLLLVVPIPGVIKLSIVTAGTMVFCLLTYTVFVRRTVLGTILGGRRLAAAA